MRNRLKITAYLAELLWGVPLILVLIRYFIFGAPLPKAQNIALAGVFAIAAAVVVPWLIWFLVQLISGNLWKGWHKS